MCARISSMVSKVAQQVWQRYRPGIKQPVAAAAGGAAAAAGDGALLDATDGSANCTEASSSGDDEAEGGIDLSAGVDVNTSR